MATGLGNYPSLIGSASSSSTISNNLITTDVTYGTTYPVAVNIVPAGGQQATAKVLTSIGTGYTNLVSFTVIPLAIYQVVVPYNFFPTGSVAPTANSYLNIDLYKTSVASGNVLTVDAVKFYPVGLTGVWTAVTAYMGSFQGTKVWTVTIPSGITTLCLGINNVSVTAGSVALSIDSYQVTINRIG